MILRGAAAPKALSTQVYDNIDRKRRNQPATCTYAERRKQKVACPICNKQIGATSLQMHMIGQHGQTEATKYVSRAIETTGNFTLDNFTKGTFNKCPVPTCTGGGKDTFGIYRHFAWKHPEATTTISGDRGVNACDKCGMKCYNLTTHRDKSTCKKLQTRRKHEILQDKQAEAESVTFTVNDKPIERVSYFKCLGRWFSNYDNDSKCILENIMKAKQRWNRIAHILKREGANAACMGKIYQVNLQAVLLYGADSWTIDNRNMRKLQSFHRRVVRHITGKHIMKVGDTWEYPNHNELFDIAKLLPIERYIERRRGTLRRYFKNTRPELLAEAEATPTHCYGPNKVLWWNQVCIEKLRQTCSHFARLCL